MSDPGKKARAQALEDLRHRHLEDLENVYSSIMGIINKDDAEDRDKNNAHKNWMTLMGVARSAPEKPPESPKEQVAPAHVEAPIDPDRIAEIDRKLGCQ